MHPFEDRHHRRGIGADRCDETPVRLDSATTIAAAVPHLLGFHPHESLVFLWLRRGELVVVQRADLPPPTQSDEFVDAYFQPAKSIPADEAIAIVVNQNRDDHKALWAALEERCPVRLRAHLHLAGGQIRDRGDTCDSSGGPWTWISTEHRQLAGSLGIGPTPGQPALSRDRVQAEFDYRPRSSADRIGTGRRFDIADLAQMLVIRPLRPSIDVLFDNADDPHGRDLVMWCCARMSQRERRELLQCMVSAVAATASGHGANLAVATAVVAWLSGDGVRANVALERCLADDPGHLLGRLVDDALSTGVPPSAVEAMFTDVPVEVLELPEGVVDEVFIGRYSPA